MLTLKCLTVEYAVRYYLILLSLHQILDCIFLTLGTSLLKKASCFLFAADDCCTLIPTIYPKTVHVFS